MERFVQVALVTFGAFWLMDDRRAKLPALQAHFEKFHDRIRLGEDDEKANLREKRDTVLDALRSNLGQDIPAFETFQQGSYAMHTGTIPPDGDYDIDVGLVFDCTRSQYSNPLLLKKAVLNALKRSARKVSIRRSCVTVHYSLRGEPQYHVDLAVYVKRTDGLLDIAKGKEHSAPEYKLWEKSNPRRLTSVLSKRFGGAELRQYRRCIRYIKRWRDLKFSSGAPLSIALTVAAYRWFQPYHRVLNGEPCDLLALRDWTGAMLDRFTITKTAEGWHKRLRVMLPVDPKTDLMSRMTKVQMLHFHKALSTLHQSLKDAYAQTELESCLSVLGGQFGTDFLPLALSPSVRATN